MNRSIKTGIFRTALAGLCAISTFAATGRAAVPELINFQGKLADSTGKAVTSVVPMVFKFYTAAAGGSPVWTETQNVTPDNYGIYSVLLGEVVPFTINFSTAYWLGVAVGTDGEMVPRYRMVSSAYSLYAINSGTAAWAAGADWPTITNKPAVTAQGNVFNSISQLVQLGADGKLPVLDGSNLTGVQATGIADGSVTTAKLADGAVTDIKVSLSTAAISSGKFGDDRVAISTQAVSGGIYNVAGKLVQLGADGFLPALNGSNLTDLTKTQVGLANVSNTSDAAKPVSAAQQTALDLKATLASPTFTGTVGGITSAMVGLGSVDNTNDANKPVSTAQQTALNAKAVAADVNNATTTLKGQIDLKANLSGATFTGAISATNLSGTNTGDQTDISGNAATVTTNANLTGVVTSVGNATSIANSAITNAMLANSAVTNLSGTNSGDNAANTTYAGDYRLANFVAGTNYLAPNGNGSALTSMTAGQVGLGSVTNTSDADKPVSTAQQTALNLKANLASPTFSGTVSGITSAMVGLGSVDNTADTAKPVSTAQQTALNLKANLAGATFSGAISATNLSGTNTGDQTDISGNAATVTTNANLTGGVTSVGNAATVVTNANLTGVVTSVGNATSIADGAISNAMLANSAVAN
ncbi:MAG: hypothetical protein NTY45_12605, partial [Elusimicrobia bacterium]|nr:hypothetical protein [Elusimicrobiota bacterium]